MHKAICDRQLASMHLAMCLPTGFAAAIGEQWQASCAVQDRALESKGDISLAVGCRGVVGTLRVYKGGISQTENGLSQSG